MLPKKPEEITSYDITLGEPTIRLAYVVLVHLDGKIISGCPFISVGVDCETGEIIGGPY